MLSRSPYSRNQGILRFPQTLTTLLLQIIVSRLTTGCYWREDLKNWKARLPHCAHILWQQNSTLLAASFDCKTRFQKFTEIIPLFMSDIDVLRLGQWVPLTEYVLVFAFSSHPPMWVAFSSAQYVWTVEPVCPLNWAMLRSCVPQPVLWQDFFV